MYGHQFNIDIDCVACAQVAWRTTQCGMTIQISALKPSQFYALPHKKFIGRVWIGRNSFIISDAFLPF
jgi:hypothetical protein